jgi:hypothetical protein
MIAFLIAAVLAGQSAPVEPAWTWTLYADGAPVVLAHEIPDTPNLRATFECERGSSIARLTLYGGAGMGGMARISAGQASAVGEAEAARGGGVRLALRTDHPVFAAFVVDGRLAIVVGDQRRPLEVPSDHLAKLRRFSELCAG